MAGPDTEQDPANGTGILPGGFGIACPGRCGLTVRKIGAAAQSGEGCIGVDVFWDAVQLSFDQHNRSSVLERGRLLDVAIGVVVLSFTAALGFFSLVAVGLAGVPVRVSGESMADEPARALSLGRHCGFPSAICDCAVLGVFNRDARGLPGEDASGENVFSEAVCCGGVLRCGVLWNPGGKARLRSVGIVAACTELCGYYVRQRLFRFAQYAGSPQLRGD